MSLRISIKNKPYRVLKNPKMRFIKKKLKFLRKKIAELLVF